MGLREDLLGIVAANKAKKESEIRDLKNFEEAWGKTREMIRSRLDVAANAMNETDLSTWSVRRDNGGIVLAFSDARHHGINFNLSFSNDTESKKVVCDSFYDEVKESFDIVKVTEQEVDRKIKEFVERATV